MQHIVGIDGRSCGSRRSRRSCQQHRAPHRALNIRIICFEVAVCDYMCDAGMQHRARSSNVQLFVCYLPSLIRSLTRIPYSSTHINFNLLTYLYFVSRSSYSSSSSASSSLTSLVILMLNLLHELGKHHSRTMHYTNCT